MKSDPRARLEFTQDERREVDTFRSLPQCLDGGPVLIHRDCET